MGAGLCRHLAQPGESVPRVNHEDPAAFVVEPALEPLPMCNKGSEVSAGTPVNEGTGEEDPDPPGPHRGDLLRAHVRHGISCRERGR